MEGLGKGFKRQKTRIQKLFSLSIKLLVNLKEQDIIILFICLLACTEKVIVMHAVRVTPGLNK